MNVRRAYRCVRCIHPNSRPPPRKPSDTKMSVFVRVEIVILFTALATRALAISKSVSATRVLQGIPTTHQIISGRNDVALHASPHGREWANTHNKFSRWQVDLA